MLLFVEQLPQTLTDYGMIGTKMSLIGSWQVICCPAMAAMGMAIIPVITDLEQVTVVQNSKLHFSPTKKPPTQQRPSAPQPQGNFRPSTATNSQFRFEFNKSGICNDPCPLCGHHCNCPGRGGLHPGFHSPLLPKYRYATPRPLNEPVHVNN